jgi:tRNA pseudouridine38-40 synthase
MKRYFINIAYQGSNYHGWQIQTNANSIQAEINKALTTILQDDIKVVGAGRTDTGVHAKELFAHFEATITLDLNALQYKLNSFLPDDISINDIFEVKEDMHARFSATFRTYQYHITTTKNPFLADTAFYFPYELDIEIMNSVAKAIMQHTDFSCFSKSNTDTYTNDCKITEAYWKKENDQLIFTITANRFLRNMVRAIVGTLLEVGQGKLNEEDVEKIIASKNRSEAGQSVAAHGLFLTKVGYPN